MANLPTTAEIYKMESKSLFFAAELLDKEVWKEDSDEFKLFKKYDPKDMVKVAEWDDEKGNFKYLKPDTISVVEISGAEYRRNFSALKAFTSYNKLSEEAQKRVNLEFWGQETRPEKGTKEFTAGKEKIKKAVNVIGGEDVARPADTGKPPVVGKNSMSSLKLQVDDMLAQLEAPADKGTKTLADLGLPDSIRDAVESARLQVAGVSADAPAPKLAFKVAKTETSKTPSVAA